jgi:hypothetical protein
VRYVGWGGLSKVFDRWDNKGWEKEYEQLKELLTDEEWSEARASTINAHYTSREVILAMWQAVLNMGFEKGNKLGGRRPGALNRSSEEAKLAVARIANQGLDAFREDIEKIRKENPIEAAKLYLRLLEYIVPKKSAIELKGEIKQQIQQVTVNVIKKDFNGITDTNI